MINTAIKYFPPLLRKSRIHLSRVCCVFLPAGLGGAVGYALGGLDWTHTFLGAVFKSQEQILFFFAAILFSVSVVLHLLSIEEQQYSPQHDRLEQVLNREVQF